LNKLWHSWHITGLLLHLSAHILWGLCPENGSLSGSWRSSMAPFLRYWSWFWGQLHPFKHHIWPGRWKSEIIQYKFKINKLSSWQWTVCMQWDYLYCTWKLISQPWLIFFLKVSKRIGNISCILSNMKLEYWYVSNSKKHQSRIVIVIAH